MTTLNRSAKENRERLAHAWREHPIMQNMSDPYLREEMAMYLEYMVRPAEEYREPKRTFMEKVGHYLFITPMTWVMIAVDKILAPR